MRPAETEARGTITNIMLIMRKLIMICMVYWMKAIMSPTCMAESAIWWPPTHTISRETPFITSIITGIIVAMARNTNRLLSARSLLALSKRFSSKSCVANARMTIMPERFSRLTRFSLSTSCCMILKRGMAMAEIVQMRPRMSTTASAMTHAMLTLLLRAIMVPPIPMMGA